MVHGKRKTSKCNNKEWEVSSAQLLKVHGYGDNYEMLQKQIDRQRLLRNSQKRS